MRPTCATSADTGKQMTSSTRGVGRESDSLGHRGGGRQSDQRLEVGVRDAIEGAERE
jgi:hypothetical protein